jgi:hypothetical protein
MKTKDDAIIASATYLLLNLLGNKPVSKKELLLVGLGKKEITRLVGLSLLQSAAGSKYKVVLP